MRNSKRCVSHVEKASELTDHRLARGLDWLNTHINLEANKGVSAGTVEGLSVGPIAGLLELLGSPQLDTPAIHITGTNGKGSTAMLASRLLETHGLSVGTYGSPHIHAINERIKVNGEPITDEQLADVLEDLRLASDHFDPEAHGGQFLRWFELVTAAAFRHFHDQAVDVGVIEVGMLGRYDATSVADTRVAVVTNVAKDHTDGADGWREKIAHEKAGIIKPASTLVLGELDPGLQKIFLAEPAASQLVRNRDFGCINHQLAVGGRVMDVRTARGIYNDVYLSLHGEFQVDNAVLAIVAVEEFLDSALEDDAIAAAFGEAKMPARLEPMGVEPLVIIDGAHNPAGARAAVETIKNDFTIFGEKFLLTGMMNEKDPVEMLTALGAHDVDLVVCCEPNWPRALPAHELGEVARSMGLPVEVIASPAEAIERLLVLASDNDLVFVGGSLYVAAAVREQLIANHVPGEDGDEDHRDDGGSGGYNADDGDDDYHQDDYEG